MPTTTDNLVGCEDCEWIGDDGELVDHWLAVHDGAPTVDKVADVQRQMDSEVAVAISTGHDPIPLPSDPYFNPPLYPPLPSWVSELRPHQWQAVQEVLTLYDQGCEIVFLDAPTGSGKTLIAELVRRVLDTRALYVCSGKDLQDQFIRDFTYASVLKGRSNYRTELGSWPEITCADCTKVPNEPDSCQWCNDVEYCQYEKAKKAAFGNDIAVLNTSYLLAEANYVGNVTKGRGLIVLDECDMLEKELMGFVEFDVRERVLNGLGIEAPAKGTHKRNIAKWCLETLKPAIKKAMAGISVKSEDVREIRKRKVYVNLLRGLDGVAAGIEGDNWVRDNSAGPMTMKPVKVDEYGERVLWEHGRLWLLMSATIVSAEEMAESLGVGDRQWGVVRVPMTFPVENRPVRVVGVANMTAREKDNAYPKMAEAITKICNEHPRERILVHTVSYDLAAYLHREVGKKVAANRSVLTYREGRDRARLIEEYRESEGAVMFAPSLDRGVDFKGDDCRVIVIAKVPFPNLGNTQVSSRLHVKGGQEWYSVQAVRSLVQMTGRGVRSEDDWCVTYVLDQQFAKNVMGKNRRLLPEWWKEGIEHGYDGRWLKR